MKAKSHLKKDEVIEAKKLYQLILQAFPKNLRAHQGLTALNKTRKNNTLQNVPQETVDQLVNFYNHGEFLTVVELAQDLTNEYPKAYIIRNILGASLAQIGKLEEAIEAYNKAIELKPDYADAYNNMGAALKDQGKMDKAIEAYNKSIVFKSNYPEAYYNIGLILKDQGKLDEAIEAYNKSIALKPDYADAYNNMGNALKDQGKLDKAIEAYDKALSLKPNNAVIYSNMGNALQDQGKMDKAIEAYNKSIVLKPDYADAYNNMGNALQDQGKLDEAIEAYNKSIALKPDYADTYNNMGTALKDQGKLDEAIEAYNKSIALKPDYAEAYCNKGTTLQVQGKFDEAIEAYNKSIALKPDYADAHKNLGLILIKSGKLKEGLDKYEWRWRTNKFLSQQRHFSKPMWNSKQGLDGKTIFLWSEQGIGDTLNWSSCLLHVTSHIKQCILQCQEKLVPLLERSFPNIEVKAVNKSLDLERDDFDFHLPMGSLYKNFIRDISKKDKAKAYLIPDPVRVNFWKERINSLGKGPYIGICWKSAYINIKRRPNYALISELYPILKLPNVTFVNLQYTDFANDLTKVKEELGVTIHNFDDLDHFNNIDDVAALCSALDMVVSTKTTVPFISAGVGTSTKLANWKQSGWNNILYNPFGPLVDIFERDTKEPWVNVFGSIAKDIFKLNKNGVLDE